MRVLIYNAQGDTKLDSLRRVMENTILPGTALTLEIVTAENIISRLGNDVALLMLPGARASTGYREQLCGPRFDAIQSRIDGGMQVLGICAGGYVLAKSFEYDDIDPATGHINETRKVSSALGIVNVKAYGPDMRLYTPRPREEGNPWSVYTIADVNFETSSGPRTAALALSKAPSFIEPHPGQCRVTARYAATGEAAMVKFNFGQGGGVLCGPVLEVGGRNVEHYVHPRHEHHPISQQVMQRLRASQTAWAELMAETMTTLLPHMPEVHLQIRRNLGLVSPTPVRQLALGLA